MVLAELGSLSLEFTRLAQITKENKYYDAIARITDELEAWQNHTKIPGLWPNSVDASGCKKPDQASITRLDNFAQNGLGYDNEQSPQIPAVGKTTTADENGGTTSNQAAKRYVFDGVDIATENSGPRLAKRQTSDDQSAAETEKPKPDCVPQGLSSPPGSAWEDFGIGGTADSTYEYLPKEYLLLGGLEVKYGEMYGKAADATIKHLLFRPMIEDEKRNVLIAGRLATSGKSTSSRDQKLVPEQAHLNCFAGGMFAMGSRIFDRKEDMDIGKRLTDACVWAYEMTPTGIMPEHFQAVPCESIDKCPFNQTLWYEKLDPYHPRRNFPSSTSQEVLDDGKQSAGQGGPKGGKSDSTSSNQTAKKNGASDSSLRKRLVGDVENDDKPLQTKEDKEKDTKGKPETDKAPNAGDGQMATPTSSDEEGQAVAPVIAAYTPPPIPSQEEYALSRIENEKLPKGVSRITGSRYLLRPEAVESVFILYRVTGDDYWRQKGWKMFQSIQKHTQTDLGASAISDVMSEAPFPLDEMESFWLAETLKYLYLLFSEPDYYSLDDYV